MAKIGGKKRANNIADDWPDCKANRSSDVEPSRTTVALVRGSSQIENHLNATDWAHTSGLRTDNWPHPCAWVACQELWLAEFIPIIMSDSTVIKWSSLVLEASRSPLAESHHASI